MSDFLVPPLISAHDSDADRKSTRLNSSPCNLVCRLLLEKKKRVSRGTHVREQAFSAWVFVHNDGVLQLRYIIPLHDTMRQLTGTGIVLTSCSSTPRHAS